MPTDLLEYGSLRGNHRVEHSILHAMEQYLFDLFSQEMVAYGRVKQIVLNSGPCGVRHAIASPEVVEGLGVAPVENCHMKQPLSVWCVLLLSVLLCHGSFAAQNVSDEVREMKIKGVTMDPYGNTPIVILEDAEGHQAFPIWIGLPEAQAIVRAMEDISTPRPMTHTLLQNILSDLQVEVSRIVIRDLRSNTFYASIALRQGPKTLMIDARPSDAIALALNVKAPIFVATKVLGSVRTVNLSISPSPQHATKKFGMHLQKLDATLAGAFHLSNTDGVLVAFVETGSQAERHGIRRGDVITDADGKQIHSLQDLLDVFNIKQVGQVLILQVTRDQQAHTIRLFVTALE